ncbi:hypothetical protein Rmet_5468 (plasmid) [Cupriavidus metallidurans CH34]|uniref:Uncharacterized protein n=1 Tax=Cupriavidus metallidurans (strain ATCC 43123 / DSM 2839 / NBRC 102507 / CH34) TaxID=266264 RepID=Q1LBZ9_CUPMC|nr:hypothetical protein Rmet_5468 [Cupriavidus metallidurans CH34]
MWKNGRLFAFLVAASLGGLASEASAQSTALLLFGGTSHKTFLGCLNCGQYESSSVCNAYGEFGSPYQADSIWNPYGTYGSKYNNESPWNTYGTSAPAIVDKDGNFYGYLSANRYLAKRTTIKGLVALTEAAEEFDDLEKLSDAFCRRR